MTIKTDVSNETYCAYCGARFPLDDEAATQVGKHILTCENHPLHATLKQLENCESALVSMVQQYLYRPLDNKTREPAENIYQHDFMSAGEEACAYLVERGLAAWTDAGHYAITLKPEAEETV